ncbi:MAG: N-acetylmuramyl-L-alanine amidase, negative regulator of AmpC, AmpD [Firmicutes bacterium]|nr:N-acetylmuramyl-L-alanine amidase, negative regulator of AmpC, AmpD [Bacillota bacterium]
MFHRRTIRSIYLIWVIYLKMFVKIIIVISLILGATCNDTKAEGDPEVVDRPILITPHRIDLIREYSSIHYGGVIENIIPGAIVVHWTASNSCESTYDYFYPEETRDEEMRSCGKLNVASHYLVDRDGTIYQLTPDNLLNRHAIGLNWCAIGIENVGGVNDKEDLTDEQLAANEIIIRHLIKKYPTIKYVFGHYQQEYAKTVGIWRENIPDYFAEKPDPGPVFMSKVYFAIRDLPIVGFPVSY